MPLVVAQDPFRGESTTLPDGTVTIPLIPHHEQRRRRLEQGLIDESALAFSRENRPYMRHLEEGEPRNLREADQVAELFQGYGVS